MNAPDLPLLPNFPDVSEGDAPDRWRLQILAVGEPLLLSRVLQRITVPEIELRSAHYEIDGPSGIARIELTLFARPARARLATARLRKIIGVQSVATTQLNGRGGPPAAADHLWAGWAP